MRTLIANTVIVAATLAAFSAASSGRQVTIGVNDDRIEVKVDGALFTALHTAKGPRKLYLHPLLTAFLEAAAERSPALRSST